MSEPKIKVSEDPITDLVDRGDQDGVAVSSFRGGLILALTHSALLALLQAAEAHPKKQALLIVRQPVESA